MAELTLEEFIRQPDVVDLHAKYDERLVSFIKGKDYIRMGKVVNGNNVIIYVRQRRVDEVLRFFRNKKFGTPCITIGITWIWEFRRGKHFGNTK